MPFRFRLPVRFADVDHAGIVYYPLYFHYFHQAFEEIFRERLGAAGYLRLLDHDKVGLPAVHVEADFRAPLSFGDDVLIEVSLARMGQRSLTLAYRAVHPERADTVYAQAEITCALIDLGDFRPIDVPERIREIFENL